MDDALIYPNWHVILVHYPLALLTIGVLIELLSFIWPKSTVRTAGRWMILLGALFSLITITTGLYAFNEVARSASTAKGEVPWSEVTAASTWKAQQWHYMRWHIILTSSGAALSIIAAIGYLAACQRRRRLFGPLLLIILVIGLGAISTGAWFGGEAVYRLQVAMAPPSAAPAEPPARITIKIPSLNERITHWFPPLQTHLALVGLTLALAAGGIGVTVRRWGIQRECQQPQVISPVRPANPGDTAGTSTPPPAIGQVVGSNPVSANPPSSDCGQLGAIHPCQVGSFWLLAGLVAIAAAAAGIWSAYGLDWQLNELRGLLNRVASSSDRVKLSADEWRLAEHFALGGGIILLSLFLAMLTRWLRGGHFAKGIIMMLLVLLVAGQAYLGVKMLYGL